MRVGGFLGDNLFLVVARPRSRLEYGVNNHEILRFRLICRSVNVRVRIRLDFSNFVLQFSPFWIRGQTATTRTYRSALKGA